jgi:hypothetical protein
VLAPPAPVMERDVYVYFDNDVKVRAPVDAIALADRLGVRRREGPDTSDLELVRSAAGAGIRAPDARTR